MLAEPAPAAAVQRRSPAARPRRRPPGGEEGLRRAGRRLRRAARPRRRVRGRDRRPGRQALDRRARAHRRARPRGARRCSPARWARTSCCASTAARARCACRAACSPTTATGSRTCSSRRWRPGPRDRERRVRHPRARRARGQRPARRARGPRGARRHAAAAARRPRARRARSPSAARETVARPLRRPAAGGPARRAVPRRRSARDERRRPPSAPGAVRDRARAPQPRRRRRRARRAASRSRARRACSAPTPTGSARDLPADEEWRIEWVKFGWGLDLAHAAAETGDPGYQQAWERLTASWIAQVRAGRRRRRGHRAPDPQLDLRLAALRRRRDEHADALLASLADQVAHVRANLAPERNHRTLELYALLSPRSRCPSSTATGCSTSPSPSSTATSPPTSAPTASTARPRRTTTLIALRSFVGARENARRYGIELPAGFDERLARALRVRRPLHAGRTGRSPRCRTPTPATTRRLLGQAAELLGDEELRFVGSRGRAGRAPALRHVSFPDGGYYVQRSGWDPERALPDLRLRPARRRRPRPLRPAELRGARRRPPARRRPGPRQLLRGAAEPAPLVPRHRRAQHRLRRRARPDALQPRPPARAGRARAVPRPRHRARARRARRRGDEPGLRGRPPSAGSRSSPTRYWIVEDRLRGRARAPLRPPLPPRAGGARRHARRGRHGARARPRADRSSAPTRRARARLGRPELRASCSTRRSSAPSRARARARASSRCSPRARPASRRRGWRSTRPGDSRSRSTGRATRSPCAATSCEWERAGVRVGGGARMTALLAPDPAVPQRDALLDERRMGALLGAGLTGAAADRCERVNAKYRVGDSLRVVYRLAAGGGAAHRRRPHLRRAAARASTARGRRGAPTGRCPPCSTRPSSRPCSGRSRTTAGSRRCALLDGALRRARPARRPRRSPAPGWWPTRPSAPRPPSASTPAAACSPT